MILDLVLDGEEFGDVDGPLQQLLVDGMYIDLLHYLLVVQPLHHLPGESQGTRHTGSETVNALDVKKAVVDDVLGINPNVDGGREVALRSTVRLPHALLVVLLPQDEVDVSLDVAQAHQPLLQVGRHKHLVGDRQLELVHELRGLLRRHNPAHFDHYEQGRE